MPSNIEIKARVKDAQLLRQRLDAIAPDPPEVLQQTDTFYGVKRGRLKMRCDEQGVCELIYYRRDNSPRPRVSAYVRQRVSDPGSRRAELQRLFGVEGCVKKTRLAYAIRGARVHMDSVDGLGSFVEIEVPVSSRGGSPKAYLLAQRLMHDLAIADEDVVAGAYADLSQKAPVATEAIVPTAAQQGVRH